MKSNIILLIIVLAVVIVFITSCSVGFLNPSNTPEPAQNIGHTEGTLTITGLDGFNGFYVVAFGYNYNYEYLYAAKEISASFVFTGDKISENQVELNVWHQVNENTLENFTGTGRFGFLIYVINKPTFTKAEEITIGHYLNNRISKPSWLGIVGNVNGTSDIKGKCEAVFKEQPPFSL